MKTYEIPAENLAKLELRISALARKAVKLGLPEPTLKIEAERMVEIKDNVGMTGTYRKVFDVSVTGDAPQIEGWTLIAIIEHLPDGNVINKLPGAGIPTSISEYYRTAEPVCEHCKLERNRKLTYLIHKETDNGTMEAMTVGSDCLKDFTGHKNPEALAKWYTILEDTMRDAEGFEWGDISANYMSLPGYLTLVSAIIDGFGWVSRGKAEESGKLPTADFALNPTLAEDVKPTDKHREEAAAAIAWVRSELAEKEDLSEYEHSLAVIFGTDESTGNAFNIKHAGYVTLHITIMEDEDGNIYVWKTSAKKLSEGETYKVRGTVKAHNDYKEIKQTILTRCTISCPDCDGKNIHWDYSEWAGGQINVCWDCYDKEIAEIKARQEAK